MASDIDHLCQVYASLRGGRATWDSWCQELGEVVSPRKAEITTKSTTPSGDKESQLYNTIAVECNMTMAHGQMSYAMPFSERWFQVEPPTEEGADDDAYAWYSKCGEVMATGIGNSNFYTEAHEACLDRSGFGTGVIYCEESLDTKSGLRFDAPPVGTYSIAENADKMVDTVYRDREMTAHQIASEFGDQGLPAKVADALNDPAKRYSEKFKVVHAVHPRKQRDVNKLDAMNMAFASCWFMPELKHKLRESGYETCPYLASRYLKWGSEVYGWCPGWQALPAARQLNMLERLMDGMAEVALYPRMLVPSTLEGKIGLGAGEITIYNPFQASGKPETWGYEGKYDAGIERVQRREQEIRDAYHYDLFRMFSSLDKAMTAREVMERANEKLVMFSPTFVRMQEEWLTPLLDRVFRIYMRQGKFPEPPPSVLRQDGGGIHVQPPKILFTSRVAMAIRSLQSAGFMNLLETLQPMLAIDPTVRHTIRVDRAAKGLGRNFGVPEEWLATEQEYQGAMQAEAQAMQAQQQAEMMEKGASAVGKLGGPQALQQMAQAQG